MSMKSFLAAALGCMCLLSASFAKADITFCNNYRSRIIIAVGFANLNTILDCTDRFNQVEVRGWYSVNPGQCTRPLTGCYPADELFWHAEADDGNRWVAGDMVVKLSNSAFSFCTTNPPTCLGTCPPFDHGKAGFRRAFLSDQCGFLGFGGYEETFDLH